jgi:amidophosphoribosyltransferase
MCGIFGVRGQPDAVALTKLGLYSLQHRGQESAGIVAVDENGDARGVRSMGLVSDMPNAQLEALHGTMAIGHTRYSTAGSSSIENAQPVLVSSRGGHISLAHNGNLTNAGELRAELEDLGSIFASSMDSEVIVHRLARSSAIKPEERLADALREVEGAYSILIVIGDTLLAARDPRGWRPLAMGRLNGAPVFGSETCALDIVGATYERDIKPGEIFAVDDLGERSIFPFEKKELTRCVFEHVYFARPDSYVFGRSVNEVRTKLGEVLALEHPINADVVVPVPDSGVCAAVGYADASGIPLRMGLIRNHYVGRTFIEPQAAIRHFGVRVKLNPVKSILDGKRVILIDDSIVRGTTSRKIVKMVRAAGASEVHVRISCPPTISPCFYGVDTPRRSELIAATHTLEEITKYLDADSVAYLSLEGMLNAVGPNRGSYCTSCYTGRYPVEFPRDEASYLQLALKLNKSEPVVK